MTVHLIPRSASVFVLVASSVWAAAAQDQETVAPSTENVGPLALLIDGPPPPPAPETIARDPAGRVTIRATRVAEPLDIDGALDESVYRDVRPASGFIQAEPIVGVPATEQTEVWVLFDGDHFYFSARCWDSTPESRWVVNEMRRDNMSVGLGGENVGIFLDTFYSRRHGMVLNMNPLGGRMDGEISDERSYNGDWNPIWEVRSGRFKNGWTLEAAIPFKSLRYRSGRSQVWGFNVRRTVRWKNEVSYLTPIPPERGTGGLMMASLAATVVGLEVPDRGLDLEVKPYAMPTLRATRRQRPRCPTMSAVTWASTSNTASPRAWLPTSR